jgi:hypothetical protein
MSGFNEEIAYRKERRTTAIGDLREFYTGARQFRNKIIKATQGLRTMRGE